MLVQSDARPFHECRPTSRGRRPPSAAVERQALVRQKHYSEHMKRIGALAGLVTVLAQPVFAQSAGCTASNAAIRLDHTIVVVRDLDAAAARFAPLGFRFKRGRLHPDSLLNRHIKFRDGSEIELMTLAGTPTSPMANDYAARLAAGEGGVYAALWTTDLDRVESAARRLGDPRLTKAGAWTFLSLPNVQDTQAIFFGDGGLPANDPDSVLAHPNGAERLTGVWLEGGPRLDTLLTQLGAHPCGTMRVPDGRLGTRWALLQGSLVVVPGGKARVLGVEVSRRRASQPAQYEPLPGFWIRLQ